MEQLEEIIRGGPCVVCGMHLGNWELVAYASKLMGAPFTGVYQRLSNPFVDEETRKLRAFLYDGGLLPKTPVTARSLMKAAKSGGYPAFLADLRDDNGAAVPFFGAPALATVFPALLARKTGLPLYAGAAFREPKVRFVIRGARVEVPHTDDPAADAVAGTAALHAQFEAFIRAGAGTMDVGPPEVGIAGPRRLPFFPAPFSPAAFDPGWPEGPDERGRRVRCWPHPRVSGGQGFSKKLFTSSSRESRKKGAFRPVREQALRFAGNVLGRRTGDRSRYFDHNQKVKWCAERRPLHLWIGGQP